MPPKHRPVEPIPRALEFLARSWWLPVLLGIHFGDRLFGLAAAGVIGGDGGGSFRWRPWPVVIT